jgi:hypothetical protein
MGFARALPASLVPPLARSCCTGPCRFHCTTPQSCSQQRSQNPCCWAGVASWQQLHLRPDSTDKQTTEWWYCRCNKVSGLQGTQVCCDEPVLTAEQAGHLSNCTCRLAALLQILLPGNEPTPLTNRTTPACGDWLPHSLCLVVGGGQSLAFTLMLKHHGQGACCSQFGTHIGTPCGLCIAAFVLLYLYCCIQFALFVLH